MLFSEGYPEAVQVLRSQEQVTENHYRKGELVAETTQHEWLWIRAIDFQTIPAKQVRRLRHDRWKNENNGWCDLTKNWAFKHGFLHACKQRPKRHRAKSPPQPVPNRGLAAVTLILCLAFALFSVFTLLHSKIFRRHRLTLIEVSRQIYRSLWQLQPPILELPTDAGRLFPSTSTTLLATSPWPSPRCLCRPPHPRSCLPIRLPAV